jgi:hypothetical protein
MALSFIIMLGLAGCATDSGGSSLTANDPAAAAAQLAADLNAIKAGSVAAEGATVKLADGFVWLQSDLTVPTGVTLDVTTDGAALGLGNVTLTVDGTVIAGPGCVRLEDNAREAVISGSGTIRLQGKGSLLQVEGNKNAANRKLTLDGVTLAGLKDNDNSLVRVGEGGTFVLRSGAITGNAYIGEKWADGGGVNVWKGTFTMEGGEISGNTVTSEEWAGGGGVNVSENSTFTMEGGEISGNTVTSKEGSAGGGVNIGEKSVFTMKGGTISGNSAVGGKEGGGFGGGVDVSKGAFIMKGGTISENSAKGSYTMGGGVRVDGGTITLEGGTISGNTATSERNGFGGGGGVFVNYNESIFTMKGGAIAGNSSGDGGGVYVDNRATFTMEDGTISNNNAGIIGGGVRQQGGSFTMKGGVIMGNSAGQEGGGVSTGDACAFIMEDGAISGNSAGKGGGLAFRNWDSSLKGGTSFTMKGGRIQGGTDSDGFAKNSGDNAAIIVNSIVTAKWGTGGTYTKGGVAQSGGSDIGTTDDTLIAISTE